MLPSAVWLFLPMIGGLLVHAPVLRFDLWRSLKQPLDSGRTFRGKRIFGDNKTWRGVIVMSAGVIASTATLLQAGWYRAKIPAEVAAAHPLALGALLSLGIFAGELPNSFVKRQLGIEPGKQRGGAIGVAIAIFDQGDVVLGVALAIAPIHRLTTLDAALSFVIVVLVHMIANVIGYAIGARKNLF
jgi:CDP-diglyceride synthetase